MLELIINKVPHGDESQRKLLEKICIINIGKHIDRPERGEYIVHHRDGSFIIKDHARDDGYWALIRQVLNRLLG